MRRYLLPIALLTSASLVLLAACRGDSADTPLASPTAIATPTVAPTAIATPTVARAAETVCASPPAIRRGAVETELLTEISGLAASRSQPGVLWAHNDSGDIARVFAMTDDGRHLGAYTLPSVQAIDWEDMALGPGPVDGKDYLYFGDIGDNAGQRSEITVYRVQEPDAGSDGELTDVEALILQYPDRPHDAEVLLVDPLDGNIYIVTKELAGGPSMVFRAPAAAAQVTVLEEVTTVDFQALGNAVEPPQDAGPLVLNLGWLPTGGDITPDRSAVAIRTYAAVWVWELQGSAELWQAFAGEPCEAPSMIEPQGEALAFDAAGAGFYTASEGLNPPLYHTGPERTSSMR